MNENKERLTANQETISLGFSFGIAAQVVGGALILLGIAMVINLHIIAVFLGSALLFVGTFLLTSSSGIQIDYANKRFREYHAYLGIKAGKWDDLDKYPYLSILLANKSTKSSDITTLNSVVQTDVAYGVYLLNKSHRKKILIKRCKEGSIKAKEEAEKFSEKMSKDLVKYSPKRISRKRV